MKKILLTISVVFLCGTSGIARKITETDFNNLVDYVNCRYANQYIANKWKSQSDSIAYFDIIAPILNNCNSKNHLSHDSLYNLLKNNSLKKTADNFIIVRKNKKNFSEVSKENNDSIIKYIVEIKGDFQKIIGNDFIDKIKKELLAEYPDVQQDSGKMQEHRDQTKEPAVSDNNAGIVKLQKSFENFRNMVSVALVLLFVFLFAPKIYFYVKTDKTIGLLQEHALKNRIEKDAACINNDEFINTVVDRVMKCIDLTVKEKTDAYLNKKNYVLTEVPTFAKTDTLKPSVKYLMGISKEGNGFNKVVDSQNEDCFFKIYDINEDAGTATFDLCVDIAKAESYNILGYSGICKNTGKDKPGALTFKDGKWKVKTPAEVKKNKRWHTTL